MEKRPTWWKMFASQREALESIPDEAAGEGLKAAFRYFDGEEVTASMVSPIAYTAFCLIKPFIDQSIADYEKKSAAGRTAATSRWNTCERIPTHTNECERITPYAEERRKREEERRKKKEGDMAASPPTPTPQRRFFPPSLEEVKAYVKERKSRVDPQGFIDFYASKGWMVGKTPMKDWKAACRNAESWERWNQKATIPPKGRDYSGGDDFLGE